MIEMLNFNIRFGARCVFFFNSDVPSNETSGAPGLEAEGVRTGDGGGVLY